MWYIEQAYTDTGTSSSQGRLQKVGDTQILSLPASNGKSSFED